MSRRSKTRPFGRKSLAQRVVQRFKGMPDLFRDGFRSSILEGICEIEQQSERLDVHPQDEEELRRQMIAVSITQMLAHSVEGLPGVPAIESLLEEAHEEYQPGGPPQSPVHDSLYLGWGCCDLALDRKDDTVGVLAVALAGFLGLSNELEEDLQRLAQARLGVYRVVGSEPPKIGESCRYELHELVTRRKIVVQFLEEYAVKVGDAVLVRPLEIAKDRSASRGVTHIVVATPYVLLGTTDPEWHDYFERAAGDLRQKLSPAAYEDVMRGVGEPRRWLEYVFVGYGGQREKNVVIVEGIPDRPETLRHHRDYNPEDRLVMPPGASKRERAGILSRRVWQEVEGRLDATLKRDAQVIKSLFDDLTAAGGDADQWQSLIIPVLTYASREKEKLRPIVQVLESGTLDKESQVFGCALRDAAGSVFEVLKVEEGVGIQMKDLVDGREYWAEERAGSTGLPIRALVFAVVVHFDGIYTLDTMFPKPLGPGSRDQIQAKALSLAKRFPARSVQWIFEMAREWQRALREQHMSHQATRLTSLSTVTTTGEKVQLTRLCAVFPAEAQRDVLFAIQRLRGCTSFTNEDGELYAQTLTRGRVLESRIRIGNETLTVESNALERAEKVYKRITSKLPGVLSRRYREVVSLDELTRSQAPEVQDPRSEEERGNFLAAVREQLGGELLDQPIPALGNLTPRQASKKAEMKAALDEWARGLEYQLSSMCENGTDEVFKSFRRELGLE